MFLTSICSALLKPHKNAPQGALVDTVRLPQCSPVDTPRQPQVTPVNTVRWPQCSPMDKMCLSQPA